MCYDVRDPKRLVATYKKMSGYGDHVQYSVFLCDLSAKEIMFMREDLEEVLDTGQDSVMIVDVGPAGGQSDNCITTIGVAYHDVEKEPAIVI